MTSSASPGARRERIRSGTEATPRFGCSCSRHSSRRTSSSTSIRGRWAHAAWRVNESCSAVRAPSSTTGKARSSWKRGCRRRVQRNDSDSRRRDGSRRHRAGVALPEAPLSRVWNRRPERFLRRRGRPPRGLVDRHVAKERRKSRAISLKVSVSHENRSPTAVGAERQC